MSVLRSCLGELVLNLMPIQFTEAAGKRKPVEQRKTAKHYVDFIKSSQRFYRGYIQRLACCFKGVLELQAVADRLTLSSMLSCTTCEEVTLLMVICSSVCR